MIQDKALEFFDAEPLGKSASKDSPAIDLGHDASNLGVANSLAVVVSFSTAGYAHADAITATLQSKAEGGSWVDVASASVPSQDVAEGDYLVLKVPPKTDKEIRLNLSTTANSGLTASGTATARIVLDYPAQHAYPAGSTIAA